MSRFIRLIRSEGIRMRHTAALRVHLIVPAAGAALFLWYFFFSEWGSREKVQMYLQVLSCVWPFLCGMICGMAEEMEADNGYQNFFSLPARKFQALLSKWFVLTAAGLLSCLIAVLGFALVFRHFPEGGIYGLEIYLKEAVVIWLGQAAVYLIHLLLSFWFGKSVSIGFGIMGTLLAFLMLTGLGDGIWMFFPWTWSGRLGSYLLLYINGNPGSGELSPVVKSELGICLAIFIVITAAAFLCFTQYEGRRRQE